MYMFTDCVLLHVCVLSLEHNDNDSHSNLPVILGSIGGGIVAVDVRKCLCVYKNSCACTIYIAT